jgi:hypothetical protein
VALKQLLERFSSLLRFGPRKREQALPFIICQAPDQLLEVAERARSLGAGVVALVPAAPKPPARLSFQKRDRGSSVFAIPSPTLVEAARSIPVILISGPEAVVLLKALKLPLRPGLYEAEARLVEKPEQLAKPVSEMTRAWPYVVAVCPEGRCEDLQKAGAVVVEAGNVLGVLGIRRVV